MAFPQRFLCSSLRACLMFISPRLRGSMFRNTGFAVFVVGCLMSTHTESGRS